MASVLPMNTQDLSPLGWTGWISLQSKGLSRVFSNTTSQSPPKLMSIESMLPPNHLMLCHPLLLQPSVFPSIRVFSNESVLCIRWPKYWSFSFNISTSNEHLGLISFRWTKGKENIVLLFHHDFRCLHLQCLSI